MTDPGGLCARIAFLAAWAGHYLWHPFWITALIIAGIGAISDLRRP